MINDIFFDLIPGLHLTSFLKISGQKNPQKATRTFGDVWKESGTTSSKMYRLTTEDDLPIGCVLGDPTADLSNHDYWHNPVWGLLPHYDCHILDAEFEPRHG